MLSSEPMPRHLAVLAGTAFGGLLLAILAWRFGAALLLSLALAVPATDSWVAGIVDAPVREEIALPAASGVLLADLYKPARPRGALLLVHGLSRMGRRQPDLARLATLLGRHGVL